MKAADIITEQEYLDDQETESLNIFDSILSDLCKLIADNQKTDSEQYGMVGACVLDNKGNKVSSTSTKEGDKWRHAERNAMDLYLSKYGEIPKSAVIITTLSPCDSDMDDRYSDSCTGIITDAKISRVYCGYVDPTQDNKSSTFTLKVTKNTNIKDCCKKFAWTFLGDEHHELKESSVLTSKYNRHIFLEAKSADYMAGHCHVMAMALKQLHPDWQIRARIGWEDDSDDDEYLVDHVYIVAPDGAAYDCRGRFENEQALIGPDETNVAETQLVDYSLTDIESDIARGELKKVSTQDIAHAVNFANNLDQKIKEEWSKKYKDSINCSSPKGFSQKAHCAGKKKNESIKENFADGKHPERKGDSARHGIPKGASLAQLDKIGHGSGRKAQLARWQANMKRGRVKNEDIEEDKNTDTAISLTRLGKFHRGADTLADLVPERATAQYALHPDKWESTFYSLTNKDSDKLKHYGPKKISIPPGTLVGDMAIANKFYRAKTAEEKEQYAELYRQSLKPYPVDVSKYRMPELLIPSQGVEEGWKEWAAAGAIGLGGLGALSTNSTPDKDTQADKPAVVQQAPAEKPKEKEVTTLTSNKKSEELIHRAAKAAGIEGTELAQFMAQTKHESADFSRMKEAGSSKYFTKKYDPKYAPGTAKILGNKHVGDGERYHGRGYIQITGRDNYRMAGKALGLPLEDKPELAARPDIAAKIAVWFWQTRVAPNVQNFDNIKAVTRKINPALRGLEDRYANFVEYKKLL